MGIKLVKLKTQGLSNEITFLKSYLKINVAELNFTCDLKNGDILKNASVIHFAQLFKSLKKRIKCNYHFDLLSSELNLKIVDGSGFVELLAAV